jgi:hypothetical protein
MLYWVKRELHPSAKLFSSMSSARNRDLAAAIANRKSGPMDLEKERM